MKYYTSKGQIDQAELARSVGGKILDYFEGFFNISYPLPKAGKLCLSYWKSLGILNYVGVVLNEKSLGDTRVLYSASNFIMQRFPSRFMVL